MTDSFESRSVQVECRGLWKIFGDKETKALEAIRKRGLSKAEVLEQFGCVVGVRDVSFEVRKSEIFCIMGLSGSGKSTLVRHINRLIEPTAGTIRISGEDVGKLSPAGLRKLRAQKVGMVFQHMALLPHRTVIDNVAISPELQGIGHDERQRIARNVLAQVQLEDWGDRYPDQLSGGMKQRVGLARAIAADPDVLLMDEPFSALDPLIRRQLQKQFLDLSKSVHKTTIFITHDLEEAIRIGDRIAIMKDGEIVQIGTPQEIAMNPTDDYVADFVRGLSKAELLDARCLMVPLQAGAALPNSITVAPDDNLDSLVRKISGQHLPLTVIQNGTVVGLIHKDTILNAVARADH